MIGFILCSFGNLFILSLVFILIFKWYIVKILALMKWKISRSLDLYKWSCGKFEMTFRSKIRVVDSVEIMDLS